MTRAELEALIVGCPFHRHLGIGLEDFDADAGWIAIALETRQEFSRDDDQVELHGGVIATLIDIAGDYAVALRLGQGVPTISLHVDYLRFARGTRAIATARIVKCGRSIAVVDITVRDEAGTEIAIGRGTYSSAVRKAA